jgi:hypothetical protein
MARRVTPSHVGLCRGPLSNWRDIGHVRLSGCCRRPAGSQGSLGHSRSAFRHPCSRSGALLLAARTGSNWRYVGHAGTGFDEEMLRSPYEKMQPLKTHAKPFNVQVKDEAHTTWLRPRLVGEVKFTEWTTGGEMRHPVFRHTQ